MPRTLAVRSVDRINVVRREGRHDRESLVALAMAGAALALVGWTTYLGSTLPHRQTAENWDIAWVGLDVAILLAVGITAWGLWRRNQVVIHASLSAAVLLCVDAWFDTLTASGDGVLVAYAMAAFVEVPGAVVCAVISLRALRSLAVSA
jgi:hypothetical protein